MKKINLRSTKSSLNLTSRLKKRTLPHPRIPQVSPMHAFLSRGELSREFAARDVLHAFSLYKGKSYVIF